MYINVCIIMLTIASFAYGQPGKCDQTPPMAMSTPSEERGVYFLYIETAGSLEGTKGKKKEFYMPDQTYVLTIATTVPHRAFKWFMITAEDPDVDSKMYDIGSKAADVGNLKILDSDERSRYSESCSGSVESADNSDKTSIEIHWVSPRQHKRAQKVRIRATVAENKDAWFEGDDLTIVLMKNNKTAPDMPPVPARDRCDLCSEARYEVIFNGKWSRMAHPLHYPTKPCENGYSHMVGASHTYDYTLWQQGAYASDGLKKLAEDSNTTQIENEIIAAMGETTGTRTLIRGKRRHYPHMSEPSHSLFRVDRYHHLISIAVGMRPSPDWFLGTTKFELCTKDGWLEYGSIPLYPWDAGTMDGVSYESPIAMTNPVKNVDRVEVGSFNIASPFYQMNLHDLKPFAILTVRRLDVYPLAEEDCSEVEEESQPEETEGEEVSEDDADEPIVSESKMGLDERCHLSEWGEWSPCRADDGVCGVGFRTKTRHRGDRSIYHYKDNLQAEPASTSCEGDQDGKLVEYQNCFVDC